jgi:hypothetical protein
VQRRVNMSIPFVDWNAPDYGDENTVWEEAEFCGSDDLVDQPLPELAEPYGDVVFLEVD